MINLKNSPLLVFLILFAIHFFSCDEKRRNPAKQYLFIAHTYQWGVKDNNRIDYRLEDFDFGKYDQLWLGGDLTARTNEDVKTLYYLDSIFNLSAWTTHWALGNHDVKHGPLSQIESITRRKSYYVTSFNGINLVVLNTNEFHFPNYKPKPAECDLLEGQLQLLENLADTVEYSSHVMVLHHHALLTNSMTRDSLELQKKFNLYRDDLRVDCKGEQTFEGNIYPLLEKIQQKGIQVILVCGDLGQRSKSFEYQTSEGIWFLGSGINNSAIGTYIPEYVTDTSADKVLIFEHDLERKVLEWKFVELEEVLGREGR